MRAYVRARGKIIGLFTILFPIFPFALFRVVHSPSITFPQNELSLFIKRPVTFHKTTRHFPQNDPSLSIKRPVTFHKTTHRVQRNQHLIE